MDHDPTDPDSTGAPEPGAPDAAGADATPATAASPGATPVSPDAATPEATGGDAATVAEVDDPAPAPRRRLRITRRQALTLAGATGVVGAGLLANRFVVADDLSTSSAEGSTPPGDAATSSTEASAAPAGAPWSDPATWGGSVPGPDDVAVVDKAVVLDTDATVAGVRVEPAGELIFDPAATRRLASTGNIIVGGALRAAPAAHDVEHVIVFDDVDEAAAVGGHTMVPLDTDVGLWVTGEGVLDLRGTARRAWTNLAGAAEAGDDTLTVLDATGWQEGDEVVVTPTEPTTVVDWAEHYDRRTVTGVDGTSVTLDRALDFPHPAVTVRPDVTHTAEVLNISRNVRVEGTRTGRAHVMVVGAGNPQTLSHVGLRRLGPQTVDAEGIGGTTGRYGLHFHMNYDGSRGTVVEGVVAYEGGNHAFVPHLSNGITFRDCIAHDQAEIAYWWDQSADNEPSDSVPTDDLLLERCVAHLIRPTDRSEGLSGFMLGTGRGNVARGCVAAAVLGGNDGTSGYLWPAGSTDQEHTWVFEDCLSHNTTTAGVRVWQNVVPRSIIDRFTSYHDGFGIFAGAYANLVSYRDCTVYACAETGGLRINAVPEYPRAFPEETITYENLYIDQAGLTDFAVYIPGHLAGSDRMTVLSGCHFAGGGKAQIGVAEPGEYAQLYTFTDCTFDGNAFWLADDIYDVVDIEVRDEVHGSITLRRADQEGELRPEWNARVSSA